MTLAIIPTSANYFAGLYEVLDTVAREKRYLSFVQAPPVERALAFFRHVLASELCQWLAVEDETVVGWCDVLPRFGEACAHIGVLVMGLVPAARHRGIGAQLLAASIDAAWAKGFSRIELTVRADNLNAMALYRRFGFAVEGCHRQAYCVDGACFDVVSMALLR